jgi:hypothetical protein
MGKGHDFNFDGGEILSKIAVWWFVSYMYYITIDNNHINWKFNLTENSIRSRKSNLVNSKVYHKTWLLEIQKMQNLDTHKNAGNLSGKEIKRMALEILEHLDKK